MSETNATTVLAVVDEQPMSVALIETQVNEIQRLMANVMKEGPEGHFGTIPGCGEKKVLFQPGAQKLNQLFRLRPEHKRTLTDLGGGHREYLFDIDLIHIPTGNVVANGVGSGSTMESKYRYRDAYEPTGDEIPHDYSQNKAKYHKKRLKAWKFDDDWKWCRVVKGENPDIADCYNTVLKMAYKRALVAATLNATAASDIFVQDLDDTPLPPENGTDDPPTPDKLPLTDAQKELRQLLIDVANDGKQPTTQAETKVCADLLFKHSGQERVQALKSEQIPDVIQRIKGQRDDG